MSALAEFARVRPVLRLRLEAFSERPAERGMVADACRAAGFRPAESTRSYTRTVLVDLAPSESELMAGFHKTARQNIRAPAKKGLVVRSIAGLGLEGRLEALLESSFERTGVVAPRVSWPALLEHAAAPNASVHVAGVFREGGEGLGEPLGFAAAFLHGQVAEYAYAGSLRDPTVKVSLLYAVAWELMLWAKTRGATLWDFGGVTDSEAGEGDDRRAGISGFKRYFSRDAVDVGEEWVLEPRRSPLSTALAALRPWRLP